MADDKSKRDFRDRNLYQSMKIMRFAISPNSIVSRQNRSAS